MYLVIHKIEWAGVELQPTLASALTLSGSVLVPTTTDKLPTGPGGCLYFDIIITLYLVDDR
jgi:hypothetical protein